MSRSVIVLPDDSGRPIVEAINNVKKSLRIKMFVFSDPTLLEAVIAYSLSPSNARNSCRTPDSRTFTCCWASLSAVWQ